MKIKSILLLIALIVFSKSISGQTNHICSDSLSIFDEWTIHADFKIKKIKKYKPLVSNKKKSKNETVTYIIYVKCVDSCNFEKLDVISGFPSSYLGYDFTVISFNSDSNPACEKQIKKGMIVSLTLSPYYGLWCLNDHEDWVINGITIPYKKVPDQPMRAKEIIGLNYCPSVSLKSM